MILQLRDISKNFGAFKALDGVSLEVRRRETVSIIGESGCGKTTLAKIAAGLIRPDHGTVTAEGQVQMVFQDPYGSLDPLYPVSAILEEAFYQQKDVPAAKRQEHMMEMLIAVGLEPGMLGRFPHEFSGGQRQRLAIARALLARPAVLVLDEPTSALDVLVQAQIMHVLAKIKARLQLTYVFISHNLRVVKGFSDTIVVMRSGKIVEAGPAEDLLARPRQVYTQQLLSAAFNYQTD